MSKIAIVGQMHYYDCAIPQGMFNHEVTKFDLAGDFSANKKIEENFAYPLLEYKDEFDYWFFLRGEFYRDEILNQLSGKKVWISTEPIERAEVPFCMKQGKNRFDYHFHYDKTHIDYLKSKGYKVDGEFQLPVDLNTFRPQALEKEWDVGFIGRSTDFRERNMDMFTPRRTQYLMPVEHKMNFLHVAHGLVGSKLVEVINQIKINLNLHIDEYPQLQHRMQNIMACGGFIISEPLTHHDDMIPYEHFVPLESVEDLVPTIKEYLEDKSAREKIAQNSLNLVRKKFSANKCWSDLVKRCE